MHSDRQAVMKTAETSHVQWKKSTQTCVKKIKIKLLPLGEPNRRTTAGFISVINLGHSFMCSFRIHIKNWKLQLRFIMETNPAVGFEMELNKITGDYSKQTALWDCG